MKSKVWLALLATSLLTGCVKYASGYQRGGGSGGGGAADAADAESSEADAGGGEEAATSDSEEPVEESGEGPAAGTSLLSACESCHAAGESAEKVVLDSSAIPKLGEALTGRTKEDHEPLADSFAEPTRADLEAEMTAIGLRLKAKK